MNFEWHNEKRKIKDLVPYVANPRQITDKQAKDLKASLDKFGVADPIIINTDNTIIGGHQRKKILETLMGVDPDFEIDVRVPDRELTIDESRELNVRLNKNVAEWNFDTLANNFELDDLLDWGFEDKELDLDLWDNEGDCERGGLNERFVIPPFTIFDTRQGYWQDRKNEWLSLGIASEVGRDAFASADASRFVGATQNRKTNLTAGETPSIFDPVLCEVAYRWFCPPNSNILDPFAGGSVRGIVASKLGHHYTGIDLSERQIGANNKQADELLEDNKPDWIVGNSLDIKELAPGEYDLIFSCPPYYDLEVYSDEEGELSALGTYDEFISIYRQIIADCVSMLKDDRFACFVVGDIRDNKGFYYNFPADTIMAFKDAGMTLYNDAVLLNRTGTVAMQVSHNFNIGRKLGKLHQNVLVFYKGDPKAIKQFGDVECGDVIGGEPVRL